MLPNSLRLLLASLFSGIDFLNSPQNILEHPRHPRFHLRHVHGLSNTSRIIFQDIPSPNLAQTTAQTTDFITSEIRTRTINTHRPVHSIGTRVWGNTSSAILGWDLEPIPAPDTTDPDTVLELAKMTNNAYVREDDKEWYELKDHWNHDPFGWEPDADGFRGHVFVSDDNSTVILTIKGTSPEWFLSDGGATAKKDKLNDNLLFSCCCARVNFTWKWSEVCDCFKGGSQCRQDCVEDALIERSLFYNIGTNLYNNVTYLYPDANIWITGHSLGGALASLLGITFGAPVVAFESPGEKLASRRLHLPIPPSTQHVVHFYNTGDPIAMGTCNGVLSACSVAGYAMETRCHLGKTAVWDTINELGWASDIRNHGIRILVDKLLAKDGEWYNKKKKKLVDGVVMMDDDGPQRSLPEAKPEEGDCLASECYAWEFV